jgi:hypothetical protein
MSMFKKATKERLKARIALVGPSGSGKTYTSLAIAQHLGSRIAVIDSERGSASKYASDFPEYSVLELPTFSPDNYTEAIQSAAREGFDVLIIDSLSHAWDGTDGALEQVDKAGARGRTGGGNFNAWREVTPMHNRLVNAILSAPMHVIVTMRAKTAYEVTRDEKTGKTSVVKLGLAPVQRQGVEYEFDIVGDMDQDNNLVISKTRCARLRKAVVNCPGRDFAITVKEWLDDGVEAMLSDQQRRDLWNAAQLTGWTADSFKRLVTDAGIASGSTRDIPVGRYREFMAWSEDFAKCLEFNNGSIEARNGLAVTA